MIEPFKAPTGKTVVVRYDPRARDGTLDGEFDTLTEATSIVDRNNAMRNDEMDVAYFAYDDNGDCVRDYQDVPGPGIAR